MQDPFTDGGEGLDRVEREARREQAAGEAEAEKLRLASRSLADVAWEAMQQGHTIRVSWIGGDAQGVPQAATGDLVVFTTDEGMRAVNVDALLAVDVLERGVGPGSAGDRTVGSFVAWCRMAEGREVKVDLVGGRRVEGRLVATASDHLLVRTRHGGESALARGQVAAVSVVGDLLVGF